MKQLVDQLAETLPIVTIALAVMVALVLPFTRSVMVWPLLIAPGEFVNRPPLMLYIALANGAPPTLEIVTCVGVVIPIMVAGEESVVGLEVEQAKPLGNENASGTLSYVLTVKLAPTPPMFSDALTIPLPSLEPEELTRTVTI